jgi:hypothetical protein
LRCHRGVGVRGGHEKPFGAWREEDLGCRVETVLGAELRAERVGWRDRSSSVNRASRSMDGRLRRMREQAGELDVRLRRHREERASWHRRWGHPQELG